MEAEQTDVETQTESKFDQFYIPGARMPETLSKVGAFVTDRLSGIKRVPIPTTYGR